MINIRQAHKDDLDKVVQFYHSQGYKGTEEMDGSEFTLIAEDDHRFIGVVRLVIENGIKVMRGMFIDESYRRQGIGKKFIELMNDELNGSECYCICKSHLEDFVSGAGFTKIDPADAPAHLFDRFNKYMENRTFGEMIMTKR